MNMDKAELLEIEKYHTEDVDGEILANALRFVSLCPGLGKKELIKLQIRDVKNPNGEIVNGIMLDKGRVPLFENAKTLIRKHLAYLSEKVYNLTRSAPLFPRRNKLGYRNSTELQKDLKNIVNYLAIQNDYFQGDGIDIDRISSWAMDEYYTRLGREHYLFLKDEGKRI